MPVLYLATGHSAGEECSSTYEGRHLTLEETYLIHPYHVDFLVDHGDPVLIGQEIVGVAFTSAALNTDLIAIDTEGIWFQTVWGLDDAGNSAVIPGDAIFIHRTAATLSKISNNVTHAPFGYALGTVPASEYAVIAVKVHFDLTDVLFGDDRFQFFGNSVDAGIGWKTTGFTQDCLVIGLGASRALMLMENADRTTLTDVLDAALTHPGIVFPGATPQAGKYAYLRSFSMGANPADGLFVKTRGLESAYFGVQNDEDSNDSDYVQLWAKDGLKGALVLKGTMYNAIHAYGGAVSRGVVVISGDAAPSWAESGLEAAMRLISPRSGLGLVGNAVESGVVISYDGTDIVAVNAAGETATLNNAAFA